MDEREPWAFWILRMQNDPGNWNTSEIEWWAYDANSAEPVQDFDFLLASSPSLTEFETFVRLCSDPECPKSAYFCGVIYLVFELAVKNGYLATEAWRPHFQRMIDLTQKNPCQWIKTWRQKVTGLMCDPSSMKMSAWHQGRFCQPND